jgi:hypothetical protein
MLSVLLLGCLPQHLVYAIHQRQGKLMVDSSNDDIAGIIYGQWGVNKKCALQEWTSHHTKKLKLLM